MPLSSANSPVVVKLVVSRSDVHRLIKRGTATDPCDTLALIDDMSDKAEQYCTKKCWSSK